MTHRHPTTHRALAVLTLALALPTGCGEVADSDDTQRTGLLFGLSDDDVEQIHEAYLADEDLADTRARLTAPFDCSLYGDFCDQVGAEAAEQITADQIELTLDGASIDEIETETRAWIGAAAAEYSADEGDTVTFRSTGPWATDTDGDYRLRVRNGVTTPVVGQRQAWTEAEIQHRDVFGAWWKKKATQICVNTGTNTQTAHFYGGGVPPHDVVLESFNPGNTCSSDVSSKESTTYHDRNNGSEVAGLGVSYAIAANGSGTGQINGDSFSRTAAEEQDGF